MYTFSPKEPSDLKVLKSRHLESLVTPLDAYWEEALIGFASHFEIKSSETTLGFCAINEKNQLVSFFLSDEFSGQATDVFRFVLASHKIKSALAGTNDPAFLSLCLDHTNETNVHTRLYEDHKHRPDSLVEKPGYEFVKAGKDDMKTILRHYAAASGAMDTDSLETGFEGIRGYLEAILSDHNVFMLKEDGVLVATSECRISQTQKPFADVGMIVAEKERRKGLGSYILALTKEFCYENKVRPICSCEAGNIGSAKAIANAGFVSRYRVVEFGFAAAQ